MSTVRITYGANDALDITDHVLFESATFEMQMNAVPGTCSFKVKDPNKSYSFITGKEIRLYIDDVPMWGGYLRRINMIYPFAADDTSSPSTYENRIWLLEGVDYNVLLDNLIIRRTDDYTGHVPNSTGYTQSTLDGWVLWNLLYSYSDFPAGFDITATRADAINIDDVTTVLPSTSESKFHYLQQGTRIRDQFDELAKMSRAAFYIGAEKSVHWHAYETLQKQWGFSDNPDRISIAELGVGEVSTWPFHEVTAEEDGTVIVNDAIIWGGSPLGSDGDVIVARIQDAVSGVDPAGATRTAHTSGFTYIEDGTVEGGSSIAVHNRWQLGETHFEGGGYGNLDGVKARALAIIAGPPGAAGDGLQKGLRYPQWMFSFSWWAHDVPLLDGLPDHIHAGDIVKIELDVFSQDMFRPCRTIKITFPGLDGNGDAYVLFAGDFSLMYTDPIALWTGVMNAAKNSKDAVAYLVNSVGDGSIDAPYGAYGTFSPLESPDGERTLFSIPFAYIPGTLDVYINGLLQRRTIDFWESNSALKQFTFSSAPITGDLIVAQCRTLAT